MRQVVFKNSIGDVLDTYDIDKKEELERLTHDIDKYMQKGDKIEIQEDEND